MMVAAELPFHPHNDRGSVRAFVLAAVIHCLLFAFLYFGISWTNQPPAPAQADLWASLPPMSSPPPRVAPEPKPEPKPVVEEPKPAPPPPVKADIEQKAEKEKPKPKKEPPPKPEEKKEPPKPEPPKKIPPKAEVKPPDDLARELAKEDMQRQLRQETARNDLNRQLAQESRAGANGASDAWASKVGAMVRSKVPISIASAVPGNPTAVFDVTVLPGREVGMVTLVKSSGYPAYDDAAKQAIQATSPLPPPTAGMQEIPRRLRFEATPKEK